MRSGNDGINRVSHIRNKMKENSLFKDTTYREKDKSTGPVSKNILMQNIFCAKEVDRNFVNNKVVTNGLKGVKNTSKMVDTSAGTQKNFLKQIAETQNIGKNVVGKYADKRAKNKSFSLISSNEAKTNVYTSVTKDSRYNQALSVNTNSAFSQEKGQKKLTDISNRQEDHSAQKLQTKLNNLLVISQKQWLDKTAKKSNNLSFSERMSDLRKPFQQCNEDKEQPNSVSPFTKNQASPFMTSTYSKMANKLKSNKPFSGRAVYGRETSVQNHIYYSPGYLNSNKNNEISHLNITETDKIKSHEEGRQQLSGSYSNNISQEYTQVFHKDNFIKSTTVLERDSMKGNTKYENSSNNSSIQNQGLSKHNSETNTNTKKSSRETFSPMRSLQSSVRNVDGPEEMHFSYIYLNQQKKCWAQKVENSSENTLYFDDVNLINNNGDDY